MIQILGAMLDLIWLNMKYLLPKALIGFVTMTLLLVIFLFFIKYVAWMASLIGINQ